MFFDKSEYVEATNSIGVGKATGLLTRSRVRNLSNGIWYETVRWYDDRGRIVQQQGQTVRGNTERTDWQYGFSGELQQQRTQREGLTELTAYTYDHLGRKTSTTHQLNGGAAQPLAYYTYDGIGRLAGKDLGGTGSGTSGPGPLTVNPDPPVTLPDYATWTHSQLLLGGTLRFGPGSVLRLEGGGGALQTLAYSWHIRGGLRGINLDNNGNLLTDRLFAMKLDYETESGYYNGNIKKQTWRSQPDGQERSYTYAYDPVSRLTGATGSSDVPSLSNLSYDANGNILSLNRAGIDDLSYTYQQNSNKLLSVSDAQAGTLGFADGNTTGDDYEYWPDGSLKKDRNKLISSIEYFHTKQPRRITFNDGQTIDYEYDAAGQKLRQKDRAGTWTAYVGNQLWRDNALLQVAHEEGRITPTGAGSYRYEWSLVDHLGNNRVSFVDGGNSQPQVVQWEAFGPWGESLPGLSGSQSNAFANPYVFTGHERMGELGVYDAKARVYDPDVPRFWQIDPLAELSQEESSFVYCSNNPISRVDPFGMADTTYIPDYTKMGRGSGPVVYGQRTRSDPVFGNLYIQYARNAEYYGHHSPYQKYFQAGGRDAALAMSAPLAAIFGAEAGLGAALSQGARYVGRTRLMGFLRNQFFRNPFSGDYARKTLAIKAGISLLGQTATNLAEGGSITNIDFVGLGADMFLSNGAAAVAGGLGEIKFDLATGKREGKFNDPGVGIGKFTSGLLFGTAGERINNFIGPNAFNSAVDATLKLYNEAANRIIIQGASEDYPRYKSIQK
jgi:RHS repeat-associated protein